MLVLGIDTATPVTSVAVGGPEGVLAEAAVRNERGHAELLAPMVRWLLEQAQVELAAVTGIAVGTGPGLFTGLRVGVSTAKALAQAWGLKVVAVPSLDVLAFDHRHARRPVRAVIDGRRGEVFTAAYRPVAGGVERVSEYQVVRPERLAAELDAGGEEGALLCGDGALRYAGVLAGEGRELAGVAGAAPRAAALVELALPRFERGEATHPFKVAPLYLRRPDIDPAVERHLARSGAGG